MTWTTWNGATAVGTGTEEIDDCQPTCAGGHGYSVKVIVTFSQPVKDCAHGAKWFWTQASFNWPNGLPPALSGRNAPTNPLDFAPIKWLIFGQDFAGLAPLARLGKVGAMSLPQSLADIGLKAMSQAHRSIVHLSGGRVLGSAFGMPAVELHTRGAQVRPAALHHAHGPGHRR